MAASSRNGSAHVQHAPVKGPDAQQQQHHYDENIRVLIEELRSSESHAQKLEEMVLSFQDQERDLTAKMNDKEKALSEALSEMDAMEAVVGEMRSLIDIRENEIARLRVDVAEKNNDLAQARKYIAEKSLQNNLHSNTDSDAKIRDAQRKIDMLSKMADESRMEQLKLKTHCANLQQENDELRKSTNSELVRQQHAMHAYKQQEADKAKLRAELAEAEQELLQSLEAAVQKKDADIAQLQDMIAANKQTIADLRASMAHQAQEAERRTFDMEERHATDLATKDEEIQELQQKHDKVVQEHEEQHRASVTESSRQYDGALQEWSAKHNAAMAVAEAERQKLHEQHENQNQTLASSHEQALQKLRDEAAADIAHVKLECQRMLADMENELGRLKSVEAELYDVQIENSVLQAKNNRLEEEIDRRRKWKERPQPAHERAWVPGMSPHPGFQLAENEDGAVSGPKSHDEVASLSFSARPSTFGVKVSREEMQYVKPRSLAVTPGKVAKPTRPAAMARRMPDTPRTHKLKQQQRAQNASAQTTDGNVHSAASTRGAGAKNADGTSQVNVKTAGRRAHPLRSAMTARSITFSVDEPMRNVTPNTGKGSRGTEKGADVTASVVSGQVVGSAVQQGVAMAVHMAGHA